MTGGFQNKRQTPFAQVSNAMLRDAELSLKAKGLLALMISFPQDWTYYMGHLETLSRDGREAHQNAMKELMARGYVVRSAARDAKTGQLIGWAYEVDDVLPSDGKPAPSVGNPSDGKPVKRVSRQTGKPSDGKPATNNTYSTNTEVTKTEDKDQNTLSSGDDGAGTPEPATDPEVPNTEPKAADDVVTADTRTAPALPEEAPEDPEDVPAAAPDVKPSALTVKHMRFVKVWNTHRGGLPECKALNGERRTLIDKLIKDCGGNVEAALRMLALATLAVSRNDGWNGKNKHNQKYGFVSLLRHVPTYAELATEADAYAIDHPGEAVPDSTSPKSSLSDYKFD